MAGRLASGPLHRFSVIPDVSLILLGFKDARIPEVRVLSFGEQYLQNSKALVGGLLHVILGSDGLILNKDCWQ